MSRRHHRIAGLKPGHDFNFAGAAKSDLDFHPLGGARFTVRSIDQPDDILLAALRNNRLFGYHARVFPHAENGVDAREHARPKLQLPVVHTAANADRAAIRVNQRINRLQLGRVAATRERVDVKNSHLAPFNFALKTLWQTEIDVDGIDVFNVDNVSAVLEVVPHIDQANAGYTVERCQNFQPRRSGPGQ